MSSDQQQGCNQLAPPSGFEDDEQTFDQSPASEPILAGYETAILRSPPMHGPVNHGHGGWVDPVLTGNHGSWTSMPPMARPRSPTIDVHQSRFEEVFDTDGQGPAPSSMSTSASTCAPTHPKTIDLECPPSHTDCRPPSQPNTSSNSHTTDNEDAPVLEFDPDADPNHFENLNNYTERFSDRWGEDVPLLALSNQVTERPSRRLYILLTLAMLASAVIIVLQVVLLWRLYGVFCRVRIPSLSSGYSYIVVWRGACMYVNC